MALKCTAVFCLLLCLKGTPCSANLRGIEIAMEPSNRTVSTEEVVASLRESVEAWLHVGDDATGRRITAIEAKTWRTYQALPKNDLGRLNPQAVRYLVHKYFAKEHGWLVKGLEPHGVASNASEVQELQLFQDKAPTLVEALLESKQGNKGLMLDDVVTMILAIEHLIFDESVALLEASYHLNEKSTAESVPEDVVHEILLSYLIVFERRENMMNVTKHKLLKKKKRGPSWMHLTDFERNVFGNFVYQSQHKTNPFVSKMYSFEEVSQMAGSIAESYGKWQDTECHEMKALLVNLSTGDTGRVPLSHFYGMKDTGKYQFKESVDGLRNAGALDETGSGEPNVLLSNYLTGPSNCVASFSYYSLCCISECDGLMNEIEEKVQAPKASAEKLLSLVGNIQSSTVDAPRELSQTLREKLHAVAERHGGEVPLYGRLFAQWLHFAFPNECPYPLSGSDAILTPSEWFKGKPVISKEDRQRHINAGTVVTPDGRGSDLAADTTSAGEEEGAFLSQWSDDEVLPLHETAKHSRSVLHGIVRLVAQLAAFIAAIHLVASMLKSAMCEDCGDKKKKDFVLPFKC